MTRSPKPPLTCTNPIRSASGEWLPCGALHDGTNPDAAPCCARCREAANAVGAGIALWLDEQLAAFEAAERDAAHAA